MRKGLRRYVASLLLMVAAVWPTAVAAQAQFGYLSFRQVMEQMPEYAKARQDLVTLKQKYEQEALRGEEDFQRKFVEFLQGQKEFPQTIMQKRQLELQNLMDNAVSFRTQVGKLLEQAEQDLMAETDKKLRHAILEVGVEQGYGLVLNTDGNSCPFINPLAGVDITAFVLQKLGIATPDTTSAPVLGEGAVSVPKPVVVPVQPVVQPTEPQEQQQPAQTDGDNAASDK